MQFFQKIFIGLLIFGAIIQMGYTALASFGYEYSVGTTNDVEKYVVSNQIQEATSNYKESLQEGNPLTAFVSLVFGTVVDIFKALFNTFALIDLSVSSISDILYLNPILTTLVSAIFFVIGIFTIIRAVSSQGET